MTTALRKLLIPALILVAAASPVRAQEGEENTTEAPTSAVKKIAISFAGGYYSGSQYFDLPVLDDRAQLDENTNLVYLFNGEEIDLGMERPRDGFAAPRKEIESGNGFEMRIGFYLNDSFHIDLFAGLALSTARLSLEQFVDDESVGRITGDVADGFVDDDIRVYQGGIQLGYDAYDLQRFGLTPSFGMGFGGVINRFTVLEDKTALYFQLYGELNRNLSKRLQLKGRATATTFSMGTEEVEYGRQVTTMNYTLGLTWLFDAKPIARRR